MTTSLLRRSPVAIALALGLSTLGHAALVAAPAVPATPAAVTAAPATTSGPAAAKAVPPAVKKPTSHRTSDWTLSHDGYQTMRDIGMARIAIFQGDTQAATDLLQRATRALDVVDKVAVRRTADAKSDMVVIDGQIVVADNFVDTPKKRTHIAKANEHLTQGRAKEAHDELRLAEVDASMTQVLMPLDATRRHLNAATTLLTAKQYYEANLALKAAEDGLLIDTVAMSAAPVPTTKQ